MKCCVLFILLFGLNLSVTVYSQDKRVSLDLREVPLEKCIEALKLQIPYRIMYNSTLIGKAGAVSVTAKDKMLKEVLNTVLEQVGLEYEFYNNVILIRAKPEAVKAVQPEAVVTQKVVKGVVKDDFGMPLPGVSVVRGTSIGCATDVDGKYKLVLPGNIASGKFSGMSTEDERGDTVGVKDGNRNKSAKDEEAAQREVTAVDRSAAGQDVVSGEEDGYAEDDRQVCVFAGCLPECF